MAGTHSESNKLIDVSFLYDGSVRATVSDGTDAAIRRAVTLIQAE